MLRPSAVALTLSLAAASFFARSAQAQDFDGDGTPDAVDFFPCDPTAVSEAYQPARGQFAITIFEDQWPNTSDLDFNDVVIAHNVIAKQNAAGKTAGVRLSVSVLALGGVFDNGLGWRIPVPIEGATVKLYTGTGTVTLQPSTADQDLTLVVIPNLRELFGNRAGTINSDPEKSGELAASVAVEILFSTPVDLPMGNAPYDLFIFRASDRSLEIHLPIFDGTAAMNRALFNTGIDKSGETRRFVENSGIPFALTLPVNAAYPREQVAIHELYPNILAFAESGGRTARDFYETQITQTAAYSSPASPSLLRGDTFDNGTCKANACYDGVQSAPETGIDCGGTFCIPCSPNITSLSPSSARVGSPNLVVTINGTDFARSSTVTFGGQGVATTFVSSTQVTIVVPAALLANARVVDVVIRNSRSAGGSDSAQFTIEAGTPIITAIAPDTVGAGSAATALVVTGSSFAPDAVVLLDDVELDTMFVSATELHATVPAAALISAGDKSVSVSNPGASGGESNVLPLHVVNGAPALVSLTPSSGSVGTAVTLTLIGTNFSPSSTVRFDDVDVPTTVVGPGQLTAVVPGSAVTAGPHVVTVVTPAPGGGTSAPQTFNGVNPAPAITSLSPSAAAAGGDTFTLSIVGSGFVPTSSVSFDGATVARTVQSSTLITVVIPASAILNPRVAAVVVTNPAPGGGTASRDFAIGAPAPVISSLSPSSVLRGAAQLTLTINGSSFLSGATVTVAGQNRTTTFVSPTQLLAVIPASDLTVPGPRGVIVVNPGPGTPSSNSVDLAVENAEPEITSLTPSSRLAGSTGFVLTIAGSGFVPDSAVTFDGSTVTATFVSESQLTAAIDASAIATSGSYAVTVTNGAPGGGSDSRNFEVTAQAAIITTLTPTSAVAGSAQFTLTIDGSGFATGATATFGGAALASTVVSPTQITVVVPATSITTTGDRSVVVTNPGSAGSNAVAFAVVNGAPILTSISPSGSSIGGAPVVLTLAGSGFIATSTVTFNGTAVTTTYVSPNQLLAQIPAQALQTGGTFDVAVVNGAPGGGTSQALPFAVGNATPILTQLTPSNRIANSGDFVLTVEGSGFVSGAQVTFDGANVTTTFVSATRLLAAITNADVEAAGSFDVVAVNPAPGGGASNALPFSVDNPAPTLTSLAPNNTTAGSASFMLTVNGTNFVPSSTIQFQGSAVTTTYVSPTQLVGAVTAGAIATSGSRTVTVVNDAPGGGTSGPLTFTVNNASSTITSLTPSTALVNGGTFTLTIEGTDFVTGGIATFNGANVATTIVSPTLATAVITNAALGTAGTVSVTMVSPGGGTSNAASFAIQNPSPAITTLTPGSAARYSSGFNLTIDGTSFVAGSQATFNGANVTTTFVSGNRLIAAIPAAAVSIVGAAVPVTVVNPAPGGGTSPAASFTITNSTPSLTSLAPSNAPVGSAAITLTVNGAGFVSNSVISFGGVARTTTFVSTGVLRAVIPATEFLTAGTAAVLVTNPTPGGGTSNSLTFTTNNATPTITTLTPASAARYSATVTVTIDGTAFVSGSQATFNGSNVATTYVSATRLLAVVPAASLTGVGGAVSMTVVNPAPGGGTSNAATFTITNPTPALTSLTPSTATAPSAAVTLTVNGSNFVSNSVINFGGTARTTTFVSTSVLTTVIPAGDLATAATSAVTVTNPAPNGGTSNTLNFSTTNPAPTITTLTPASTARYSAGFTLTVDGTNFVAGSQATFNGSNVTTTYVSATRVLAAIPASAVDIVGATVPVTIVNPAPGGGTSPAANFTISNPTPALTSLTPSTANAGGAAVTLTVNGSNFVSNSVINFAGTARTTTFVSTSQLTTVVSTADLATASTPGVYVTNPAPNGGTSNTLTFTINNSTPTITTLTPATTPRYSPNFTLTIDGTNFVAASQATFNGANVTTTYVSATRVLAAIPTAAVSIVGGTVSVTIVNPAPGGGTSNASTFTISNPTPALTSLTPSSATAPSAAVTLTVNGSNFVSNSVINFGGTARTTTFVSTGVLTTVIPSSDLATAATSAVTVTNPAPNGGTSNSLSFTTNNPAPTITTLTPATTARYSANFTLTVDGTNFVAGSQATFNGSNVTTTYVSATRVLAAIPAAAVSIVGAAVPVTIVNPAPGGGTSAAATFTITNPTPTLTSLTPSTGTAGGAAVTLTVNGSNFVSNSVINFAGTARTTTFVSTSQLTTVISTADLATASTPSVTVTNPAPNGGTSNALSFSITNPVPTITALTPASTARYSPDFNLTIDGTNFVAASQATFNGANVATTYVSSSRIVAAIPTAAVSIVGGTVSVTVVNPAPGGGTSNASTFTIANPTPALTSLTPNNATAGSAAVTLTVNGSNFVSNSVINFAGTARTTTFVSTSQLTTVVSAADLATAATPSVTVTNPAPNGGTSGALTFTINNPAPTITTLTPPSATRNGAAFTLTIDGTNFVAGSQATFNGSNVTTTYSSATRVYAAISAAALTAAGGVVPVTIVNPTPGGGTSAAANFTINNPVPTLSSLNPSTANVGSAAITLTVNGTNFVTNSVVNFGGVARTTTYVSTAQLTAVIPAADLAAASTPVVYVTNPTPAGGNSNTLSFTINNAVPTITTLIPTSIPVGSAAFSLTIDGTNFVNGSQATFNGSNVTTTYSSSTRLYALIPNGSLTTAAAITVTVVNAAPGGGTSNAATFNVTNPAPTLSSISPSTGTAPGANLTLTLTGSNFVSGSVASFGGTARTTTYVSASQLYVAIPSAALATGGTFAVNVTNAGPGGGTTSSINYTLNQPTPAITSVSPTPVSVNSAAFTLTIDGSNFMNGATATFNGTAVTVTYSSATRLYAAIPSSLITTTGLRPVVVTNPAPNSPVSNSVSVTVQNPVPTLSSINPSTANVNAAGFTLTVNGSNFVSGASVVFNGSTMTTSFSSSSLLYATIPSSQLTGAGNLSVYVSNPAPGGGSSGTLTFSVNYPTPSITSITPSSGTAPGSAFNLTINGSGFVSGSQVYFNGFTMTTTYVSSSQLRAAITATQVALGGTRQVYVYNPTPGGGFSNTVNYTNNNPVPSIGSFSPNPVLVGAPNFTMTVTGSGFVADTTATVNGFSAPVQYSSSSLIYVGFAAQHSTPAGTRTLTVTNASPNGGSSGVTVRVVNTCQSLGWPTGTQQDGTGTTIYCGDGIETDMGAGLETVCAINYNSSGVPSTTNPGARCWGWNSAGQLGDGTQINRSSPRAVLNLPEPLVVSTGQNHSCALSDDQTVRCWGSGGSGQIGDGGTSNRLTATAIPGVGGDPSQFPFGASATTRAVQLFVGRNHNCMMLEDQSIWCWGANGTGQLGDGTLTNRPSPVEINPGSGLVTSLAGGLGSSCARFSSGIVRCWGDNAFGQLGNNSVTDSLTPVQVSGLTTASRVWGMGNHFCVILTDSTIRCWGDNSDAQLGDGTVTSRRTPVRPSTASGLSTATQLSANVSSTCARSTTGSAFCWSINYTGQIGDGTTTPRYTPYQVITATNVQAVAAGNNSSCARLTTGQMRCWGRNDFGELGDGTTTSRLTPVFVLGMP